MWIASTYGFFSIVHKPGEGHHVRARCRADATRLAAAVCLPPKQITTQPGTDYPWRFICDGDTLLDVMEVLGRSVVYPNFKQAIADTPEQADKGAAYHSIHYTMAQWQRVQRPGPGYLQSGMGKDGGPRGGPAAGAKKQAQRRTLPPG
jgi:hypothetical protein